MNLPVLDVAIGISFVFLLLSLICTTVNEMLAGVLKSRAKFLDKGITRLLGGNDEIKKLLYKHPMIQSLASSDTAICPSYIPANKFVTTALDLISGKGNAANDMAAVRAGIKNIPNEHLQVVLTTIMDKAHDDAAVVQHLLEQWFNENMDRVSGWYKKHTQVWAIILASIITIVMNADALRMASLLWTTPTSRAVMVEQAKVRADKPRPDGSLPPQTLTPEEKAELAQLTGWESDRKSYEAWRKDSKTGRAPWDILFDHLLGWIFTAIAVSMGAPFWFDTLNRFMNIRNAGRSPDEKKDKAAPGPAPANA